MDKNPIPDYHVHTHSNSDHYALAYFHPNTQHYPIPHHHANTHLRVPVRDRQQAGALPLWAFGGLPARGGSISR